MTAFRGLLKIAECEELLKIMDENDFDKLVEKEDTLPHGMLFVARCDQSSYTHSN